MPLPVVPIDSANEKQHRAIIATVLNELAKQFPSHGSWTATVRGSGTAGTYEIDSQLCRYTRIGRRVWLDGHIVFAGTVTGGGTGDLNITGVPFAKAASTFPIGSVRLHNVNYTASASQAVAFTAVTASSTLYLAESNDNAATSAVPISGISASDQISFSISYETDDP